MVVSWWYVASDCRGNWGPEMECVGRGIFAVFGPVIEAYKWASYGDALAVRDRYWKPAPMANVADQSVTLHSVGMGLVLNP